jgi:biotin carboxylase
MRSEPSVIATATQELSSSAARQITWLGTLKVAVDSEDDDLLFSATPARLSVARGLLGRVFGVDLLVTCVST